jgi:V/A-type H+-transporting ATPase subunit E
MQMDLNNLIDKIKREGVEQAEKDARDIIKEAEDKARGIILEAENKKNQIIREGTERIEKFKKSTEKSLKQTSRDVLLTLRERVIEFFDRIVKDKVSGELGGDVLGEIIIKAVENLKRDSSFDIEVLVNEKDRKKLEKTLFSALSKEAKDHIKITGKKGLEKGFRIGEKGKDSYFDFTDEAITEAFKRYLNPKLVQLLDLDLEKPIKK